MKILFLCEIGIKIGFGHYRRASAIQSLCTEESKLIVLYHDKHSLKEILFEAKNLKGIVFLNLKKIENYFDTLARKEKMILFIDGMSQYLNSICQTIKVDKKVILSPRISTPPEPCIVVNRSTKLPPRWNLKPQDTVLAGVEFSVISNYVKDTKTLHGQNDLIVNLTEKKTLGVMLGASPEEDYILSILNLYNTFRNKFDKIIFCYRGPIDDEFFFKIFAPTKIIVNRNINPWFSLNGVDTVVTSPGISLSEALYLDKQVIVLIQNEDQLYYATDHLKNPKLSVLLEKSIYYSDILSKLTYSQFQKKYVKIDGLGAKRILNKILENNQL